MPHPATARSVPVEPTTVLIVQVDRFIALHEPEWTRLDQLTRTLRRSPAQTSAGERQEFLQLYQATSTHLSQLRSHTPEPALDARLTRLLAGASHVLYGQRQPWWKSVVGFFAETFPAAVWHTRRFHLVATALFLVPAVAVGTYLATSEEAQGAIPPEVAEAYLEEDFEAYYSSEAATEFATTVFINNIWVAFLAFAVGIVFCVGSAFVLMFNGALVGQAGGLFASAGELPRFFGLILPHGMLELTAIWIAGGAGLVLGWALIAPGDRSRADALGDAGRRSVVIVIGLVFVFGAAALIEGFVTGAPIPTWIRVGIGVSSWTAFMLYVITFGRRAALNGRTGAFGEDRPTWNDEPNLRLSDRASLPVDF